MTEDNNQKYWDEIEQEMNKLREERAKEKEFFAEHKQRKSHGTAGKKGKRSKQYVENDQVIAAIAAVEALTAKPENVLKTDTEIKLPKQPTEKSKGQSERIPNMTDTGSMIMLGPVFPLEEFDHLVAEKEEAEKTRVKAPVVLGAPVCVDQTLLMSIEEKVKIDDSKEKKNQGKEPRLKASKERKPKAEPRPAESVKPDRASKPKAEPRPVESEAASMRLDEAMDAMAARAQKVAGQLYHMARSQGDRKEGEPYYGPLSYEKLTAKRKVLWTKTYEEISVRVAGRGANVVAKLAAKEMKVGEKAAKIVDRTDVGVAQFSNKAQYLWIKSNRKVKEFEKWAKKNKQLLFRTCTGVVATAAVAALLIGQVSAYEYMYNGKVLGVVKNQDDVYQSIDVIGSKMSDTYGAKIEIDKEHDISFHRVLGWNRTMDTTDDILNSLSYMRDVKAKAYGIYVGEKPEVIVQSKEMAERVLQEVQGIYTPENTDVIYDSVGFTEKVKVKEVETKLGKVKNEVDAVNYLLTGAVEKTVHEVSAGETFSGVAHANGLKQSELAAMNPRVNPEKLQIGQELYLQKDCPVLTVKTEETITYHEPLTYDIVYQDTNTLYKGEKTVQMQGANGEQAVVAKVTKQNGMEVKKDVITSEVISRPINQVVLVGTKAAPKLVGTGNYQYPVRGARLTSKFGSRWGRFHSGIDLACSSGTKIGAADGGTVSFAGYKGSFGYLVIINHGGGRETYYAHCSKLLVSRGQKVYQGQHIANVGNTGRSTGPHVHFEVHINGNAKNPLNYL